MHLIKSHGLVHLQFPEMVFNLIFSYSGEFFILLVPVFAFSDLDSVAGALASEDRDKKAVKYLSLFHIPGNRGSCFLPQRAHIFPSFPFIIGVPSEAFIIAVDIPDQI